MRTFEYSDSKSHKFWNIEVEGKSFTVTYGRIGASGQTQTKSFASAESAEAEAGKLIREKTAKGYSESTPKAVVSDRDALEAAVRANPHDHTPYGILSDYLIEQGDPLGEFIAVQMGLENESTSKEKRAELKAAEKRLLKKYKESWLGGWVSTEGAVKSGYDWTPPKNWVPYRLTCGLWTGIEIGELTAKTAKAISQAPTKFVRELIVHGLDYEDGDDSDDDDEPQEDTDEGSSEYPSRSVLVRWPFLRQIQVFRFGGPDQTEYDDWCPYSCHTPGDHVFDIVKQMPDIEDLRIMAHVRDASKLVALPMPRLHTFQLYHGWSYPLAKLAKNPTLGNLRELYCHPHAQEEDEPYIRAADLAAICRSPFMKNLTHLQLRLGDFGDKGVKEIVSSGMLKRLKTLDLRHGTITDEGALMLAESPDIRNLSKLDLAWNQIGPKGEAAIRKTGVAANLFKQYGEEADEWERFAHGDIE